MHHSSYFHSVFTQKPLWDSEIFPKLFHILTFFWFSHSDTRHWLYLSKTSFTIVFDETDCLPSAERSCHLVIAINGVLLCHSALMQKLKSKNIWNGTKNTAGMWHSLQSRHYLNTKNSVTSALGFAWQRWKCIHLADNQLFELIRYIAFNFVLQTSQCTIPLVTILNFEITACNLPAPSLLLFMLAGMIQLHIVPYFHIYTIFRCAFTMTQL